jgi:hypothetical protein
VPCQGHPTAFLSPAILAGHRPSDAVARPLGAYAVSVPPPWSGRFPVGAWVAKVDPAPAEASRISRRGWVLSVSEYRAGLTYAGFRDMSVTLR